MFIEVPFSKKPPLPPLLLYLWLCTCVRVEPTLQTGTRENFTTGSTKLTDGAHLQSWPKYMRQTLALV